MKELPKNVSESIRRRNPHLYGPLAGLQTNQPKPTPSQALASSPSKHKGRKRRLGICVTIIALRRRLLDSDNSVGSCKPLRDAIAKSIGIDDGDKIFRWQCEQIETRGREGTIVRIETV